MSKPRTITLAPGESYTSIQGIRAVQIHDVACPHLTLSGEADAEKDAERVYTCEPCGITLTIRTGKAATR